MEIPAGTDGPINPEALRPATDMPRFTPLEKLVLAAAPIADLTTAVIGGMRKQPPEFFPGQAVYLEERTNVITLDGSGSGRIHLVAVTIPVELVQALARALQEARGTKLVEQLQAKTDARLGSRVQIHRPPHGEIQG